MARQAIAIICYAVTSAMQTMLLRDPRMYHPSTYTFSCVHNGVVPPLEECRVDNLALEDQFAVWLDIGHTDQALGINVYICYIAVCQLAVQNGI